MIKVTNLTKRYGDRVAVNDISFQLETNKIIGFLGPNGAGKSTTMNLITGYIAPDKGSVIIDEISMMKFPQKAKKKIGYLPEIPPIYMDMTVEEYIRFVAELKQVEKGKIRKEADRVMKIARVDGVRGRLIRTLSKGYRQRVGLAQALLTDPEILILDEPTVGLDPKQIVEIRKLIQELGKNHTVILSTHILSEVQAVCDEIVIISRGRIVAHDTPENLVKFSNIRQELTLAAKANATTTERVLMSVQGIEEYRIVGEAQDECRIDIVAKEKTDLREYIMQIFEENGIRVLELGVHELSLEDVYLKLTSDTYLDMIFDEDSEEEDMETEYSEEDMETESEEGDFEEEDSETEDSVRDDLERQDYKHKKFEKENLGKNHKFTQNKVKEEKK